MLFVTMLGAMKTGFAYHESMHIFLPVALLVLLGIVIYQRRSILLDLNRST